jgi:hypothetical protein
MLDKFDEVGLTGPGRLVGTLIAEDDQVLTDVGHEPFGAGANLIEPGVPDDAAQFTYALVCIKSVTYGARVRIGLKPAWA